MRHLSKFCICAMLVTAGVAFAQSPFDGTWKMNLDKSKLTGDTFTIASQPDGMMKLSADGMSYTFKTDGQDYKGMFGRMVSWKDTGTNTWEETVKKQDGTVLETDSYTLSSDGKTLHQTSKGTRPDGSSFNDETSFGRMGGSSGLAGTWKDMNVKLSDQPPLVIKAKSADELTMSLPAEKAEFTAKLDGQQVSVSGPNVPPGFMMSLKRTGDRSMRMTEYMDGKPVFHSDFSVSADGKMLTENGRPEAVNEPFTVVYDKQS